MSILESIALGIIQGITEFLPISSSGHLILFQKIFGISEPQLFFDTMVHLGTLFAVTVVMWQSIVAIFKDFFSKYTLYLITAVIPAGAIGFFFQNFFEEHSFSGMLLGYEFLLTAFLLILSEIISARNRRKREMNMGIALFIGGMQALGIFGAVSRSGATIAGGLMSGIDRTKAATFSFLISIPIILGSVLKQGYDVVTESGISNIDWLPVILGTVCAAISGYFAVKFMLALISKKRLYGFAIYVAALGVFVLIDQYLLKVINWA